jgi:hypothetical protein
VRSCRDGQAGRDLRAGGIDGGLVATLNTVGFDGLVPEIGRYLVRPKGSTKVTSTTPLALAPPTFGPGSGPALSCAVAPGTAVSKMTADTSDRKGLVTCCKWRCCPVVKLDILRSPLTDRRP